MVHVQPAKTEKFLNLENFRLYGSMQWPVEGQQSSQSREAGTLTKDGIEFFHSEH